MSFKVSHTIPVSGTIPIDLGSACLKPDGASMAADVAGDVNHSTRAYLLLCDARKAGGLFWLCFDVRPFLS